MIRIKDRSFEDISDALRSVSCDNDQEVVIDLGGRIHGQITIDKPHVTLKNGSIENDLGAYEILEDGLKRGTFRTYTLYVCADDVHLENVDVINSCGYHDGQAIALMVDADGFRADHCRFSSYQDTLFLGPLPDEEYEPRGFIGPMEKRERRFHKARFENCVVEGSIDFIFGSGSGYFRDCEIRSRDIGQEVNGYVCAPSTPEKERYGFIFDRCAFTSEAGMKDSVYLARPWRDYGKCLIVDSRIGDHIRAEGYHDWNKKRARKTCEFKEWNNLDSGKKDRVDWMKTTDAADLKYIDSLRQEEKR